MLDQVIPTPRLLEVDHAELGASPERVWELLRHGNLGRSPLIRALFAVRTLPDRLRGKHPDVSVRIDDLRSSAEKPGFQILLEDPPREFVVGAIGKVWQLEIPFVHVGSKEEFLAFAEPDYIKVAWAVRVRPLGAAGSRVEFEVRVDATDEAAWRKFQDYFRWIGPASHLIRKTILSELRAELGTPEAAENTRPLAGDELLSDAEGQATHGITIAAPPEAIWPWLLQMGCQRGGFYSIDWLDNAGIPSARELHPELLHLAVGEVIPATPKGEDGFEVLRVEAPNTLILGGLHDTERQRQLPFTSPRPEQFWQVTWAFVLERLDPNCTRLHVRARYAASGRLHAAWIRPVHHLMQSVMLRNLAARAEGRLARDAARDVLEGLQGAGRIALAMVTPFLNPTRRHWGLSPEAAARTFPGDEIVPEPRWSWTHGIEIPAAAEQVWPWIAQIGADRAGFYSYQWLENLIGCEIHNAERIHPEWEVRAGDTLKLHPDPQAPRFQVVDVSPGRYFVAKSADLGGTLEPPAMVSSWAFVLEPLGTHRCRLISRYRAYVSDALFQRLAYGPTLLEPIGFAMDRRMLLGVKERVERSGAR